MISSRRVVLKVAPNLLRSKEALLHPSNNRPRSQLPKLPQLRLLSRSSLPLHLSSLSTRATTRLKCSLVDTNGLVEQNNVPLTLKRMKRSRTHRLILRLTRPLTPGTLSLESFPTPFALPGKAKLVYPLQPQLKSKQRPRHLLQLRRMSLIHLQKMQMLMPPLQRL